ncbi:Restriction endonuclease ThaI [Candidatus Methanoperedenaceae archaeon GB50]|nr:Restriction endonuclease ThaI [Candidatus Methanoperedenaceae archaeon GB50]
MEVGSLRERIIISLLIYKFGEANVETEIPITEPEVDVKLFGEPVSIKQLQVKDLAELNSYGQLMHKRQRSLEKLIIPIAILY